MTHLKIIVLALCAALLAAGLVACGGGGGDEDPQQVIDDTFSGGKDYASGILDVSFKLEATGSQESKLDATVKGPFQNDPGGFPRFDLDADVKIEGRGQDLGFAGGLVSTGDKAYVNFQNTDYEVDSPTFDNFKSLFLNLQQQNQQQKSPGFDTSQLFADLSDEGTEEVNGTDAIHISGNVDVGKFIDTIKSSGGTQALPGQAQLEQLRDSVKSATFDVYSSKDSNQLQKLDVNLDLDAPATSGGGGDSIAITFSLGFSDLGQPQTITAPANAEPLSNLLDKYGLDAPGLGQALQGAAPSGGGASATPTPTPPSGVQSNAYLECLSQARGQDAIQACASQLQ